MVSKYFKKICCINKLEQTVIIMSHSVAYIHFRTVLNTPVYMYGKKNKNKNKNYSKKSV